MAGRSLAMRALLLAITGLASCRSAGEPRERIADLEDRRVARPEAWEELLSRGDEATRRRAALGAGRVREPSLLAAITRALKVEASPRVREEQLFALGQIRDGAALDVLLPHLGAADPGERAAAAEAIGKLGVAAAAPNLIARLGDPDARVRGASLLGLARLVGRRAKPAAALDAEAARVFLQSADALLRDGDDGVRWKAAYALSEVEVREPAELSRSRLDALIAASAAPDSTVRFFAAQGLARAAAKFEPGQSDAGAWPALRARVEDPDAHVAAMAATGLGGVPSVETARALAAAAVRFGRPDDFHRRKAAVGALGRIAAVARLRAPAHSIAAMLEEVEGIAVPAVVRALDDPSLGVRGEALRALATLAVEPEEVARRDATLAEWLAPGRSVHERVAATRALAAGSAAWAGERLMALARTNEPYVASEALAALAELASRSADPPPAKEALDRDALAALARERAASNDLAVAASALQLLAKTGGAPDLPIVAAAYGRLAGPDSTEARVEAVKAAAALAPGGEAIALLERARLDPAPAVAAAARAALAERSGGGEAPRPPRPLERSPMADDDGGAAGSSIELVAGEDFGSAAPNPCVRLRFDKGDVEIELLREEAPRHVKMLLERVRAGLCDGLPIHRVVSGFVVQGLDPRGDGWGTGGVFLRDEIQRVPYERGAVGMPNAGPDSGGCQIFVTHVPTPHLDGSYTVYGRVTRGMEVIDALDVGDVCEQARVIR